MSQFDKRNISMMMDLYEMTMADCYFAEKDEETQVVFDVFYRKNPDQGGFAIFAGLEQIVEYIEDLHFDEDDISYFSSLHLFSEKFLQYLKNFRFKGDIYAFPEGTVMYPNGPVLTVIAPLIDAQLIETAVLAQINHQSLIATKTQRIVKAAAAPTTWMQPYTVPGRLTSAVQPVRQPFLPANSSVFPSAAPWRTAMSCTIRMN